MWDLRPTLISRKDTPWFPNQSLSGKQAWKSSTLPHATSAYPLSHQNFIVEELEHTEQDTTEKCVSSSDHRVLSNITTKKLRSWHPAPSLHDKQTGKICKQWQTIFLGSKITVDSDCSHEIKRCLLHGKKTYDKPRQCTKKQRCYFADKGPNSQSYGFSSSHVRIWELDHKKGWAPKNWCFQTVVLEKTLESPLDCRDIKTQLILKEINPEYSLEGLKLKLQYFGHLI